MNLVACTRRYFSQYLVEIKGVSPHTIKSYKDTFLLFLPFAAQYHSTKIKLLNIDNISTSLIFSFLDHLEKQRNNLPRTRNQRLAALKSMARMITLIYPEHGNIAESILSIPQKRAQKKLIGFMYQEEIEKIFSVINREEAQGFRNFTILHLLYDSGARASEIASLKLDYFDCVNSTLAILGKGNRYRQVRLWPKTTILLKQYISKYRLTPKPLYRDSLFLNKRREEITRHGIYRLCERYLRKVLDVKRIKGLNPVHSFRHSCAINLLANGASVTEIKNQLGHENIQTTMTYLNLNLNHKREVQKKFVEYTKSVLISDSKIDEIVDWDNKKDILVWLDSL